MMTERFKIRAASRDETHHSRLTALLIFQQLVHEGAWCEIWQLSDNVHPESGYKIADFPGINAP